MWIWNIYWFVSGILSARAYCHSEMRSEIEPNQQWYWFFLAFFFGFFFYPIALVVRWHARKGKPEEDKRNERAYYRAIG